MAFVNEYVSKEDIEKYGLDELYKKYSKIANNYNAVRNGLHNKSEWMVDRENDIWLMLMGVRMVPGEIPPIILGDNIYILQYKGKNIEVIMERNKEKGSMDTYENPFKMYWNILSLFPESIGEVSTEEIVDVIQKAMESYGYAGMRRKRPVTGADVIVKVKMGDK